MKDKNVTALLALNFLVTGGLSALLLTKFQNLPITGGSDPVPVQVDLTGIDQPLTKVSKDLDQLTSSIQRFQAPAKLGNFPANLGLADLDAL